MKPGLNKPWVCLIGEIWGDCCEPVSQVIHFLGVTSLLHQPPSGLAHIRDVPMDQKRHTICVFLSQTICQTFQFWDRSF
jgi:hypothetical protein